MRDLRPISGRLKRQLLRRGWRQLDGRFWVHPAHPLLPRPLAEIKPGTWVQRIGYTLRAAARRARLLPRGW